MRGSIKKATVSQACSTLIPVLPRLVSRPWGGTGLAEYKGLSDARGSEPYGESFEVSAWDADPETAANPSFIRLPDGDTCALTQLLDAAGEAILGKRLALEHGRRIPLLPKVLCVRELLSVQAHPPQRPEVYVILEAEEGASLRLGWRKDVSAQELGQRLEAGRELQTKLLSLVSPRLDETDLGRLVSERLGSGVSVNELIREVLAAVPETSRGADIEKVIRDLHELYWYVLDLLAEVPAQRGTVIYNASTVGDPLFPDAEVHALGNPTGKEFLCLEVRLPGSTHRAWDNCRYPMRPVDIATALSSMPLRARDPNSFVVEPRLLDNYPGVRRFVENGLFVVDHIEVRVVPCAAPGAHHLRTLHGLAGEATVRTRDGSLLGVLRRGQCSLVPACLGEVVFEGDVASVVQVTLPY